MNFNCRLNDCHLYESKRKYSMYNLTILYIHHSRSPRSPLNVNCDIKGYFLLLYNYYSSHFHLLIIRMCFNIKRNTTQMFYIFYLLVLALMKYNQSPFKKNRPQQKIFSYMLKLILIDYY